MNVTNFAVNYGGNASNSSFHFSPDSSMSTNVFMTGVIALSVLMGCIYYIARPGCRCRERFEDMGIYFIRERRRPVEDVDRERRRLVEDVEMSAHGGGADGSTLPGTALRINDLVLPGPSLDSAALPSNIADNRLEELESSAQLLHGIAQVDATPVSRNPAQGTALVVAVSSC